jgi:hypothetical protein
MIFSHGCAGVVVTLADDCRCYYLFVRDCSSPNTYVMTAVVSASSPFRNNDNDASGEGKHATTPLQVT